MVKVEFPDGTVREVQSQTREIKSKEIGVTGSSSYIEEPIEDEEWRYLRAFGNKWIAQPQRR